MRNILNSELIWLRTGVNLRSFWIFRKRRWLSWIPKRLLAFQKQICCMEVLYLAYLI